MNGINSIIAIDPGNIESGYCKYGYDSNSKWEILEIGKYKNEDILPELKSFNGKMLAIEMVASYGMPVGKDVFETCVWIGRFMERWNGNHNLIYRRDIKLHLCNSMKAKDSNIIQSLVDRFGDVNKHGKYAKGTKKNPGFFYGFSEDMWSAFAVAVYQYDLLKDGR